jgi:regulatory protein
MDKRQDKRRQPQAGKAPDAGRLRDAALLHLSRYAATRAGLIRVLHRRIDRWARRAEAEGTPIETIAATVIAARADAVEVAHRLTEAGAVDDAAFATSRLRRLQQSGRSRRAIAAHLAAKGVDAETAGAALEGSEADEVVVALGHLRRRRAGPFAASPPSPEARLKAMGALARAGFPRDVAEAALDMDPATAEDRLLAARRG